jgi:hypothetical protein
MLWVIGSAALDTRLMLVLFQTMVVAIGIIILSFSILAWIDVTGRNKNGLSVTRNNPDWCLGF